MEKPSLRQMLNLRQQLTSKMEELKKEMSMMSVTGTAAGGMVQVTVDGKGFVKEVRIEPSLASDDTEMLEDCIVAAANSAQREATKQLEAKTQMAAGGLGGLLG